jgi:hypothetical protein
MKKQKKCVEVSYSVKRKLLKEPELELLLDAKEKGEKGRDELENSIADLTWLSLLYALGNQSPKKLFHQDQNLSNCPQKDC